MKELQINQLMLVSGGAGKDTIAQVIGEAIGSGEMTYGKLLGGVTAISVARIGVNNQVYYGTAAAAGAYVTKFTDDAINSPPYNGRPIFEIEHGLTAQDGTGY